MNVYIFALSDTESDAERRLRWGDYWFKDSLGKAITKLGHVVTDRIQDADVFINLHGGRVQGMPEWTWNVLWIIGHPDAITREECDEYDAVYSESEMFAEHVAGTWGITCAHLAGASDFEPLDLPKKHDAVFVGNWRPGREFPKVAGTLQVWGEGWDHAYSGAPPENVVLVAPAFPHDDLQVLYASASQPVNQTYPDMERWGFHNPRYYDIAAVRGEPHPTFDECAAAIMAGVPTGRIMLDLGCGEMPRRGMEGIDRRAGDNVMGWNLEKGLPWLEWSPKYEAPILGHADVIVADNLLEHIDNLIPLMNDCHDALLPAGRMHIVVPNAQNPDDAWADPTHRRAFVPGTFAYFDAEQPRWQNYGRGYGIQPWRMVYCRVEGRFIRVMMRPAVSNG